MTDEERILNALNLSFFADASLTPSVTSNPDADVTNNATENGFYIVSKIIIGANKYGLPVIIFVGLLGNTLSFIVFAASHLRHHSSSVYLAFLNFADCLFLICLLISQLDWYSIYLMRIDGVCQLVIYFSYVGAFLSVWTVVSFTVERFIVVYFPLMRLVHCTRKRAITVVLSLFAGALLLYNFALWASEVHEDKDNGEKGCYYVQQHLYLLHIATMADTFVTMVIPSVVVIVLNILIVFRVWMYLRQRNEWSPVKDINRVSSIQMDYLGGEGGVREVVPLTEDDTAGGSYVVRGTMRGEDGRASTSSSRMSLRWDRDTWCVTCCRGRGDTADVTAGMASRIAMTDACHVTPLQGHGKVHTSQVRGQTPSIRRHTSRSQALQLRTTRTLLIISSLFIILNLPSHAIRVWRITVNPLTDAPSKLSLLWQLSFQFLYYLNFSSNFFLYCACSQSFRVELRTMLARAARKVRDGVRNCVGAMKEIDCGKREE